jgi:argininosuccinate lyase
MATLWKQETKLHPTFDAINRCLADDWFLLPFELRLQQAHAAALTAAGILSGDEHASLGRALDTIERNHSGGLVPVSQAEDIHTWLEEVLTELAGEAGRKIHTARSRNDQVATLLVIYVIETGRGLGQALIRLVELFGRRAKGWSELAFPLQTHTQFAAPGTVGFWALRYAVAFDRIRRHAKWLVGHWRESCPLGSGAVAGSSIPIDRRIQARELGFVGPSKNALASTTCRDEVLEYLALAAQVSMHLQGFAADVIAFSQTPLGWSVYPKAFATGSSMMPNKSNPDAMELLRGECCKIAAAHGQALLLLKGLPSGYNRDLQCLKPMLRDTAKSLGAMLEMTAAFVDGLDFDAAKLAEAMKLGEVGATLRMEQKVRSGMPLREAHHAVAEELKKPTSAKEAEGVRSVEQYQTIGSASPIETRRVADELLAALREEK